MTLTEDLKLDKESTREVYPDQQDDMKNDDSKKIRSPRALGRRRNFRPIILCIAFFLIGLVHAHAQIETAIGLAVEYTDNVFQLSDYDLARWKNDNPKLDFVETTDDLQLALRIDLSYPIHYRWWTFTPSVTGKISQNLSNTEKERHDALLRMRVDRHYWSLTALYGYYPYIYYRDFTDSDGTGENEKYSYERNLYRAELVVRPLKKLTTFGNVRYENMYYNQYFTEADGSRLTTELGARYSFPSFSLQGSYSYRSLDNTGYKDLDADDGSYDSNMYRGVLRLRPMPFSGESTKKQSWHPYLELAKEDRYYQGNSAWYGGRTYHIYNTKAGLEIKLHPDWKLSLDYLHNFRNVESPSASVLRLKEFSENRLCAAVNYRF
ncbi:MAG: porin family protein [Candidatus Cloacimonetes bacterium]|jgi:hypothetical protein|nr:porin family protein [Candidatus Cloacimonadota bacterium]MDY0171347.1 hypothetical protein [Candidatus Cloacimonadaceae bacterium]